MSEHAGVVRSSRRSWSGSCCSELPSVRTTIWYGTEGVTAAGEVIGIPISRLGLRRAEIEGQMDRLRDDPELIGLLVVGYERRRPERAQLVELRIIRHRQPLRSGRPDGDPVEQVVLEWRR